MLNIICIYVRFFFLLKTFFFRNFLPPKKCQPACLNRPKFLIIWTSQSFREFACNFMSGEYDEDDWRQWNGNDLKSPKSNMANRAEFVETDILTTGLLHSGIDMKSFGF